jgi:hypothetical protein
MITHHIWERVNDHSKDRCINHAQVVRRPSGRRVLPHAWCPDLVIQRLLIERMTKPIGDCRPEPGVPPPSPLPAPSPVRRRVACMRRSTQSGTRGQGRRWCSCISTWRSSCRNTILGSKRESARISDLRPTNCAAWGCNQVSSGPHAWPVPGSAQPDKIPEWRCSGGRWIDCA